MFSFLFAGKTFSICFHYLLLEDQVPERKRMVEVAVVHLDRIQEHAQLTRPLGWLPLHVVSVLTQTRCTFFHDCADQAVIFACLLTPQFFHEIQQMGKTGLLSSCCGWWAFEQHMPFRACGCE